MGCLKVVFSVVVNFYYSILDRLFGNYILNKTHKTHYVYGDAARVKISTLANVNNALFNVASGFIIVEDFAFCAHDVLLITGTHDYTKTGYERQSTIPLFGRDIIIKKGAWIGSRVTVLGPCVIGENAVVAAHSLVNKDVPSNTIVGGVPAKYLGTTTLNKL